MAPDPAIPVRLDPATIARFDRIAEAISVRGLGVRVSRSDVIRMVIERGLPGLETELGVVPAKRTAKKRGA